MSGNNLVYQRDINSRGEPMAQRSQNGAAFVSVVDPVTGMPSIGATTTSAGVDRSVTTSTTSSQLMAANTARRGLFIVNDTAIDVWINFGATAVAAAGAGNIKIGANGGRYESGAFTPSTAINIIAASGTPAITAREFIAVSVAVADAPVIGAATAGRESASLTFTPGASNGGYTVQDYLISAYDSLTNARFNTFTATSSPASLAPIPAGISAYFKVQARTPNGYSTQSGASNAVNILAPFAAPGAPTGVNLTTGIGVAYVTYTAPAINGGSAITTYRSTLYRVSDNSVVDVVSGTGTLTHSGLEGGYQVYARVEAANVPVGYGQPSSPSTIKDLISTTVVAPHFGPISQRNRIPNFPSTPATIQEMGTWSFHDIVSPVPAGQVIGLGFTNITGVNEVIVAPGEVRSVVVEYPAGTFTPFTFSGSPTGVMGASRALIEAQGSLAVDIPENTRIWSYNIVRWTGANSVFSTDNVNRYAEWRDSCRESVEWSTTTVPDRSATGVRPTDGNSLTGWGYRPCYVRSMTTKPTFAIVDDSQGRGSASQIDTNPIDGLVGQSERRWFGFGTINVSVSGDSYAETLVNGKFQTRALIAAGCTFVHDGLGANDGPLTWTLGNGTYWPQMKAKFPGSYYLHSTFDPKTISTDFYATIANQTPGTGWAVQQDMNTRMRNRESTVLDGFLDDAAMIEDPSQPGYSKVPPLTQSIQYVGTIAAGTFTLNMPAGTFNKADHDMRAIVIKGAGTAGADYGGNPALGLSYMQFVSDTQVILKTHASTQVPNKPTVTAVTDPIIVLNAFDYMLDGTGPHRSPFGEKLNQGIGFA